MTGPPKFLSIKSLTPFSLDFPTSYFCLTDIFQHENSASISLLNNDNRALSTNIAFMLKIVYNFFGEIPMKREIKDKLIEFISFVICLIVIVGVAMNFGLLKDFKTFDFDSAFAQIKGVFNGELKSDTNPLSKGSENNISKVGNYQPNRIPDSVLKGAVYSRTWTDMFNSRQKVIFYIYNSNSSDFNTRVQNFVADNRLNYSINAYEQQEFNNIRVGTNGPTKMCNSLEECNRQRQNASDYTSMSAFLNMCGKTICVINPSKRQFVRLRAKNSTDAINMIDSLKNW